MLPGIAPILRQNNSIARYVCPFPCPLLLVQRKHPYYFGCFVNFVKQELNLYAKLRGGTCWHFPAHAVHHVGSWSTASWRQRKKLELASPPPFPFTKTTCNNEPQVCRCELLTGPETFRSSDLFYEYHESASSLCFAFSGVHGVHSQSRITVPSETKKAPLNAALQETFAICLFPHDSADHRGLQQWRPRTNTDPSTFPLSKGFSLELSHLPLSKMLNILFIK